MDPKAWLCEHQAQARSSLSGPASCSWAAVGRRYLLEAPCNRGSVPGIHTDSWACSSTTFPARASASPPGPRPWRMSPWACIPLEPPPKPQGPSMGIIMGLGQVWGGSLPGQPYTHSSCYRNKHSLALWDPGTLSVMLEPVDRPRVVLCNLDSLGSLQDRHGDGLCRRKKQLPRQALGFRPSQFWAAGFWANPTAFKC